jgi:pimeloyl-ACP methyl ester carboxylesterase
MEMIEVDGLRITYERAGSGPPLVLLHGYVGDGPTTWRPSSTGSATTSP